MLQLKNIKKDYITGNQTVNALKGINLTFRKSEFVSILGPSGCGKTTMLNIIGGLDKYSDGDLIINDRSTTNYNDREWDTYRNHSIGFVFQSYNLIPHQSVLQNVELALTLSGVSKNERRQRAKQALIDVGLGEQIKKKPSEMSGGQMQRVAIARAIVNNPDIILADEPTGALDSETSVAVMDILKEISKDRLVIMVTHNPELAEKYSTRIVRMLDGNIISDSDPANPEENQEVSNAASTKKIKERKPSMSFATSFGLSLKNLITKKGRTILTSFAGSIGIIGIALIFAVSNGMTAFINSVQEDTLSSYPLTLESQHTDIGTLMETFIAGAKSEHAHDNDAVYQKPALYDMVNSLNSLESRENDLKTFKKYIEEHRTLTTNNELNGALNGIKYTYNADLLIYTKNVDDNIIVSDSKELMTELLSKFMGGNLTSDSSESTSSPISMISSPTTMVGMWQEMLSGENGNPINELYFNQYDLIYGTWPTSYNEIILVVDENNELDDMTLYALGLESKEKIDKIIDSAVNKTPLEYESHNWSYEEICSMEFKTILNSDCYIYDSEQEIYTDLRSTSTGLKFLYDNGLSLKVTGIIRPNKDAVSAMLSGSSIGYTHLLTEYIAENNKESAAIKAQLENQNKDIFTGLPFKESTGEMTNEEKEQEFREHVASLNQKEKAAAYIKIMSIPSDEMLNASVENAMKDMNRDAISETLTKAMSQQTGMDNESIEKYISNMSDEELNTLMEEMIAENVKTQYAQSVTAQLNNMSEQQLSMALDMAIKNYTTEQCAKYHDEVLEFSNSTYEANLQKLGFIDLENPSTINLYASSFENKDVIEEFIAEYNEGVDELEKITYTDYVGIMMSSVTTIINAITYVLIAFVAVSLIVSSIMIGVITLISVQERTKEIGILRAIGASKKNVSSMFNAETVIIGFTSGLLGIAVTYLLCIPINAILRALTGLSNLKAILPIEIAVILIIISILLTLLAGIIPSKSAAKKDPVIALRTE
ncbi:MAG: ATP-binding cassette domain-containing protein [Acutalibacteraceae bacterium]|nr:ATP-binding cassette domain-containing protein [Acutalibacteraceae bacterium]